MNANGHFWTFGFQASLNTWKHLSLAGNSDLPIMRVVIIVCNAKRGTLDTGLDRVIPR